jgi:hypothetical protein
MTTQQELSDTKIELSNQLEKTESALTSNINRYRTDTSSSVAKILRPPRTLGAKRKQLIQELRFKGMHGVAFTIARGCEECLNFASQLEGAFKEAGWIIGKSTFPFITKDAIGLFMMNVKGTRNTDLTKTQLVIATAFKNIGMPLTEGNVSKNVDSNSVVQIYVGLQ